MFARLRNWTGIFMDAADEQGYGWFLAAKIGPVRVYSRSVHQSANIVL